MCRKSLLIVLFASVSLQSGCRDPERLVFVGKINELNMARSSIEVQVSGSEVVVSNGCGTYEASASIQDLMYGSFNKSEIIVHGWLGEWCDVEIDLKHSHYIFDVSREDGTY